MTLEVKEKEGFRYIEEGEGEILLLLHGLFGALSNWEGVVQHFKNSYKIIIPLLPIYELPRNESTVDGLVDHVEKFVEMRQITDLTLVGNSLGGHIALVYALRHPEHTRRLVLTGSSGLFENSLGGSYVKRGSYEYIKERVEYTFYDPTIISEEYINEVFEVTSSIQKALRVVAIAKSAQRHNLANDLHQITAPALLIWGLNDTITPPYVAHEFNKLIKNSTLRFLDKCCHAPMMEHPQKFNELLEEYLEQSSILV
ncbi:MAG: alpha/beta hydrolase [Cytophagales bacterium]|nr:alpha/beta hydrolase [Cytophagales bacterium]